MCQVRLIGEIAIDPRGVDFFELIIVIVGVALVRVFGMLLAHFRV